MKIRSSLLLSFSLALILCACGGGKKNEESQTARNAQALRYEKAFKVAVTPTIDCLPVYLLVDSQMFDTAKVDIRYVPFSSHQDIDTALVGGGIQAAFSESTRLEYIKRKTPLTTLASTCLSWQLIANKRARLKELSQLSDKMIACTPHSALDQFTSKVLKIGKPKYEVFRVQVNNVNVRLSMLLNNEMDAMWLPEPQASYALSQGHNSLSPVYGNGMGCLVARSKDAIGRKEQVADFVRAYNKACDAINAKGLRHYRLLIKKYMDVDDKTINNLQKTTYDHAEY